MSDRADLLHVAELTALKIAQRSNFHQPDISVNRYLLMDLVGGALQISCVIKS